VSVLSVPALKPAVWTALATAAWRDAGTCETSCAPAIGITSTPSLGAVAAKRIGRSALFWRSLAETPVPTATRSLCAIAGALNRVAASNRLRIDGNLPHHVISLRR